MLHISTAHDFTISVSLYTVLPLRADLDRLRGVSMALDNSNQFNQNVDLPSKIQFNIATQKSSEGRALLLRSIWVAGRESLLRVEPNSL